MKKHAMTILLVLAALALGLWLWLDRDRVTEGERKKRENSVFTAWRRDELSRLVIAQEGETITLVRDPKKDTSWRMTTPREERADVAAVERLMTTLEFAVIARKVAEGTTGLGLARTARCTWAASSRGSRSAGRRRAPRGRATSASTIATPSSSPRS
jgi:hypothetical protein